MADAPVTSIAAREGVGRWVAPSVLLAASLAFRLPPLINAAGTNSDAAIVGVQAMHLLRGEWSPFLFGSGYQTSVDSMVAALWFLVAGPSPLALMLSTLVGHLVLLGLVYATLRRYVSPWITALACTPWVFTTGPLHTYILYPPRQASLAIAVAAFWALDRASSRPSRRASFATFALGGALGGVACYADPYAMLFMPVLGLFALLCAMDRKPPIQEVIVRLGSALAGVFIGALPYVLLRRSAGASHGQTALSLDVVLHNAKILWDEGLPCVLGTRVYYVASADYEPWPAPLFARLIQLCGAAILVIAIASAAALFFRRPLRWELRRLGLAGLAMVPVTIGGFLVSPMVMDFYSARYLVAFVLLAPFAMAPLASLLSARKLTLLVVPVAITGAMSGWLHFGRYVDGFAVRTAPGRAEDERALQDALRARDVHAAIADYWASYRLTYLFREDPVVVPTNPAEDRYAPHRAAFQAAEKVAYIFDPLRSREARDAWASDVAAGKTPFLPQFERVRAGAFEVLVLRRAPR